MYDPNEANKSYMNLLKDNGTSAALKSALVVISTYVFNKFTNQPDMSTFNIVLVFFFFCIYYSFKPKFIRFLKDRLVNRKLKK